MRAVYQKSDNVARVIFLEGPRSNIANQYPCMGTGGKVIVEMDHSGRLIAIVFPIASAILDDLTLRTEFKAVKDLYEEAKK